MRQKCIDAICAEKRSTSIVKILVSSVPSWPWCPMTKLQKTRNKMREGKISFRSSTDESPKLSNGRRWGRGRYIFENVHFKFDIFVKLIFLSNLIFLSTFDILVKFDIFVKFDILINCWYLCQLLIVLSTFWSKYQLVVPLNCNFAGKWYFRMVFGRQKRRFSAYYRTK